MMRAGPLILNTVARRWQSTTTAAATPSSSSGSAILPSGPAPTSALANAEYRQHVKRGTAGLYESVHHKQIRHSYPRHQLRASFWGPREWFQLARRKAQRLRDKSFPEIVALQKSIMRHNKTAPTGYPFLPVEQTKNYPANAVGPSDAASLWNRFRSACATLYPTSAYAIEERVIDDWHHFIFGRRSTSALPQRVVVGGAPIKLTNPYSRRKRGLALPDACSTEARQLVEAIDADCHPFVEAKLEPDSLEQFVRTAIRNEEDVRRALPLFLQRWRWLTMGQVQSRFMEPTSAISDRVIALCCEHDQPMTALHLLRNRTSYKLAPTSEGVQALLDHLILHHHDLAMRPEDDAEAHTKRAAPPPYEPPANPFAGKRSAPKHAFPFRMGPRMYFYRALPYVLNPEPSPFANVPLPRLPDDNDTKRLLPDDQRKKLKMMMDEAQRTYLYADARMRSEETPAMQALTAMYEVFYLATSRNPRHYALDANVSLYDSLVIGGVVGGTKEGAEKSVMAAKEALDAGKLSPTAYAAVVAGTMALDAKLAEEVKTWSVEGKLAAEDRLGFGFAGTLAAGSDDVNAGVSSAKEISSEDEATTASSIRQLLAEKLAPMVESSLLQLQTEDKERFAKTMHALENHQHAQELLSRLSLK